MNKKKRNQRKTNVVLKNSSARMFSRALVLASISCLFFASCKRTHKGVGRFTHKRTIDPLVDRTYVEARLTDLSLPIGSKILNFEQSMGNFFISYETSFSLKQVQEFYTREMERLGWRMRQQLGVDDKRLVIYEKPTKTCVFDFQAYPSEPSLQVRVFMSFTQKQTRYQDFEKLS